MSYFFGFLSITLFFMRQTILLSMYARRTGIQWINFWYPTVMYNINIPECFLEPPIISFCLTFQEIFKSDEKFGGGGGGH